MKPSLTEYVAGFAFEGKNVALVVKNRPDWQKGKLNGIGGHIEMGETPLEAMKREFWEETGRDTELHSWNKFAVLSDGLTWRVHFFYSYQSLLENLQTMTDEQIVVVPVNTVNVFNALPNLSWLMPMAAAMPFDRAKELHIWETYG